MDRMKNSPEVTTDPDQRLDVVVRRYMDLGKYLDLLLTQQLYLRRADKFTDRFEGALTPAIRGVLDDAHESGHILDNADAFCRRARMGHFVSCWNLSAKDNMALWQLYGGAKSSIAVTTTVSKLVDAGLRWQSEKLVLIRKVKYIDHFKDPNMSIGCPADLLQFKHDAYSFEKEIRVIVPRALAYESNPESLKLPLGDLNGFIRSVVVAPEASESFFNVVKDVTKKYGVSSPVKRSKLTHLP
jgi:hypothetical protein